MSKLPVPAQLSAVTRRYLRDFLLRMAVFLLVLALYVTDRGRLDLSRRPGPVLWLLWAGVLVSMLAQLDPRTGLTVGCHKQYPSRFEPVAGYDPEELRAAVRSRDRGALRVFAVWFGVNLGLGLLYRRRILGVPELVLLCAFFFLSDLICVLFFCPFQTFLMKNRCCISCRIFAWGSWMMAAPLMCVPHWYAQSLFWTGVLVLLCWEVRYRRHPERFWEGSNRSLRCASCQEQLCRYKFPRSPRFR